MKHLSLIIFFLFNFLIAETPFKVGESLKYSADFNLIRVGQAELNVIGLEKMNDLETYHVTFSANTSIILFGSFKGVSPVLFTEVVVIGNPNLLQSLGPKL